MIEQELQLELKKVPTPDLVVEFATLFYQAEYEKMDTAKKVINEFHKLYDSVGDVERSYLTEFEAVAGNIARGLHKITLRYKDKRERYDRILDNEIRSADVWKERQESGVSEFKENTIQFIERAVPAGIAYVTAELSGQSDKAVLALLSTGYIAHFLLKKYSVDREDMIQIKYDDRIDKAEAKFGRKQKKLENYVDKTSYNYYSRGEKKLREVYKIKFGIEFDKEISAKKYDRFSRILGADDASDALKEYSKT